MKKVVSIIATIAMVMSLFTGTVFANQGNGNGHEKKAFKDMKGHWGSQSVDEMQSLGILDGYADGTFQPDKTLTQGELAVIIARMLNITSGTVVSSDDEATVEVDMDDVPSWAKDAVSNGFHHNYLNQKRFHSKVQCDRLTACVAIAKALALEPVTDFTDNPFKDRGLISDEDFGYLLALYKAGYINGYPDGNFNPNKMLSRAQIASIIAKLIENGGGVVSDDKTAPDWDDSALTASAITANSVKLAWSGAEDDVKVTGYKISYEVNDKNIVKYASTATITITGLEADEDYTFTVEAKDAAGNWSDDGPAVTITTNESVADITDPTWSTGSVVTATAIKTNSVDLKWSGATDDTQIVGYKVTYDLDGTTTTKIVANTTTVRISGLTANKAYSFTVEAKDAAGNWSDNGPSVTATTLAVVVVDTTAPTWASGAALTVSTSESGIVTLVWPDAEDNVGVKAYKVYQNGVLIKTLDADANNVNVTGLSADTEYAFKVRAVDTAGNISTSLIKTFLTE